MTVQTLFHKTGVPFAQGLFFVTVEESELRGAAALVLAALVAEGKSKIQESHHLDRGYEDPELKINNLGGNIYRTNHEKSFTY